MGVQSAHGGVPGGLADRYGPYALPGSSTTVLPLRIAVAGNDLVKTSANFGSTALADGLQVIGPRQPFIGWSGDSIGAPAHTERRDGVAFLGGKLFLGPPSCVPVPDVLELRRPGQQV